MTISHKFELITKVENGASRKELCFEYGTYETMVCDIFKQKEKLMSDNFSAMKKWKTMKNSSYEELTTAMAEWIFQVRNEGMPTLGPIITAKTKELFDM